mmetsp:Transcript_137730/g.239377  ORF Transcript_137730/g.239377 Transcript_137730/m.239377 type:complete len:92 (-) Transcript_137730:381-656(-)
MHTSLNDRWKLPRTPAAPEARSLFCFVPLSGGGRPMEGAAGGAGGGPEDTSPPCSLAVRMMRLEHIADNLGLGTCEDDKPVDATLDILVRL